MAELSPQAQAVLSAAEDAYGYNYSEFYCCADRVAAAALRAAVDQVMPLYACSLGSTRGTTRLGVRQKLIAIAAELEGADG